MNLSTYVNARARFFSSLESNGELSIVGPDISQPDLSSTFTGYCPPVKQVKV